MPETSGPELNDPDVPPAPELKNPEDGSTVELNSPGPPHWRKDTRPGPMVPLPVTGIAVSAPPMLTVNSGFESATICISGSTTAFSANDPWAAISRVTPSASWVVVEKSMGMAMPGRVPPG